MKSINDSNNLGKCFKIPHNQLKPRHVARMQMMALLNNQYSELAVSLILRLHPKTVSIWNKRFQAGGGIQDLARSGRPPKITFDIVQKVIAFYCQQNPLPGCSSWSIRWMADYFQKHPDYLNISISASSIHRCLTSSKFRLYRRKYFLQICDPYFFEKMEKIIQIYKLDPEYLFCLDECTGLQALERTAPSLPADSSRPEYREFEYIRHGTVSIISILEKRTGKVYTECIPDHTSTTIITSVKKHATQFDPSKTLHYICDNYSSHSTKEFCQGIAELCNVPLPKLKTAYDRKQWLESDNKRIIFHFLPTHGSWLNLIEIWFSILKQKALSKKSFSSINHLENSILDFSETWNNHFAHPFNWKYTGEDLYDKVVSRLIRWLELEVSEMTIKFLEKQLKLMSNLHANHYSKIKKNLWINLRKTFNDKRKYILKIINTIDPEENKSAQLKREKVLTLHRTFVEQLVTTQEAA